MRLRFAHEPGQASLESIALSGLVAAIALGGAAIGAKPALGDAVVRQFERGVCVVRGGDCERDRAPCVISSDERGQRESAAIGFVRIDAERSVLVERLSDGQVRLTLLQTGGAGLEAGLGATLELDFGKVALGVGGELRAAALAAGGFGGSYLLPSSAAAEKLRGWIERPARMLTDLAEVRRTLSTTESVYGETGVRATIGATGVIDPVVQGDVTLDERDSLGVRRNVRDGHRTFYFRRSREFDAALGVGPDGIRRVAGFGDRQTTIYGLEVDASGRPVDFSVSSVVPLRDAGSLPPELAGQAAQLLRSDGERVLATERHLDLTQAENLDAVKGFVKHVAAKRIVFGALAPVVERLGGRLDGATYSARAYTVKADDRALGGSLAVGAKIELGAGSYRTTTELIAALDRGPSGEWAASSFCKR